MSAHRSYLYVPGDRPERLAKALTRGSGAIIADLEDSVTPDKKDDALGTVADWLGSLVAPSAAVWVRVNGGARQEREIRATACFPVVAGFLLPKTERHEEVADAHSLVRSLASTAMLAPMIESATGLTRINAIAASPGVTRIHLGEMDLAVDLGLVPAEDEGELLYARSLVVVASRHAGLSRPTAPVSATIDDMDAFRRSTERLARAGFFGRDCIHPAQVAIAESVFAPSDEEIAWARDVLALARLERGAFRDAAGHMVDEAILRRARAIAANH